MYTYEYVSGKGLPKLVDYNSSTKALEIGCDIGETSEFLLLQLPNLTLHAVDPYTDYVDWNGNMLNQRESMFNVVKQRFSSYGERFVLHRKTSDEAVNDFINDQFDLIFIDGIHTYEQVLLDCENYYSKLKEGGIFSGHDFNSVAGVGKAVKEFAAKHNKDVMLTESDVWYWVK
jgi:predicted O-methyltransferase YrrM